MQILSPLQYDFLRQTEKYCDARGHYSYLCCLDQIFSDCLLSLPLSHDNDVYTIRQMVRNRSVELARLIGHGIEYVTDTHFFNMYLEWYSRVCTLIQSQWGQLEQPPFTQAVMPDLSGIKFPECFGYDLCDLEVCVHDARYWLTVNPEVTSALVVGVRTGGAYFAPWWVSELAFQGVDVQYITIRPIRNEPPLEEICFSNSELESITNGSIGPVDVILIDDQPDTWATINSLVLALQNLFERKLTFWVSSPGRIYKVERDRRVPIKDEIPLVPRDIPRIWESLSDESHPRLLARLRDAGLISDETHYRVDSYVGTFSSKYLTRLPYVPWNDYITYGHIPKRINPRKNAFVVVDCDTGIPVYHAKFVGVGVFEEFQRNWIAKFGNLLPEHYFLDGYLFTRHESLTLLKDHLTCLSTQDKKLVLDQVARYWDLLNQHSNLLGFGCESETNFKSQFKSDVKQLSKILSIDSLISDYWIDEFVPNTLKRHGETRTFVHSSLKYSHNYWHWYVREKYSNQVIRFHIDSNWGEGNCIDIEIASFVLEHQLATNDVEYLCSIFRAQTGIEVDPQTVWIRLTQAFDLNIRSWIRRCKNVKPGDVNKSSIIEAFTTFKQFIDVHH